MLGFVLCIITIVFMFLKSVSKEFENSETAEVDDKIANVIYLLCFVTVLVFVIGRLVGG